jgi:hypothetical protein
LVWYIIRDFGNFGVICNIFSRFLYIVPRKIWQPWRQSALQRQAFLIRHRATSKIYLLWSMQLSLGGIGRRRLT